VLTAGAARFSLFDAMDAFPAFFPLAGATVIVAGDGDAAEARLRLFEGSPATVVRVTGADALAPEAYAGATLVFVAGGGLDFLEGASRAARTAGAAVNVVDHPEFCDFVTPAVIDRGSVVVAVGTAGASPLLAAILRNDIEARVPEGVGRIATLLGGLQDDIRRALPDLAARRAFLRQAIDGPAARAAMDGDMEAARRLLIEALAAADTAPVGRITAIHGAAPVDLLSLRAVRALGRADVVVVEDGCSPDVLAFARRDARRIPVVGAMAASLIEMAAQGLQVVWLTAAPVSADRLTPFVDAKTQIEVLGAASAG